MCSPITQQADSFQMYDEGLSLCGCLPCSRVTINWDKIILISNTAMILAGIAYMFFLKLPILSFGLGFYAMVYLAMNRLAERAREEISNRPIVVQGNDKASKEGTRLQKEIKGKDEKILKLKKKIRDQQKRIGAYQALRAPSGSGQRYV